MRTLVSLFSVLNTYAIIRAAQKADMSPAIALSFTSLTMFLVPLIFFILFKERLTSKLIFGMLIVLFSVILVGISKASS